MCNKMFQKCKLWFMLLYHVIVLCYSGIHVGHGYETKCPTRLVCEKFHDLGPKWSVQCSYSFPSVKDPTHQPEVKWRVQLTYTKYSDSVFLILSGWTLNITFFHNILVELMEEKSMYESISLILIWKCIYHVVNQCYFHKFVIKVSNANKVTNIFDRVGVWELNFIPEYE